MRAILAIAAASAALALAACGGDDNGDSSDGSGGGPAYAGGGAGKESGAATAQGKGEAGGSKQDGAPAAKPGITVKTADSQFGEVLFDGDDRAIYYFDKESSATSECYGACAEAWPPVLTDGKPQAGGAAEASLLGTTKRDDGSTQVTYDGRPLYFYVDDPQGEVLCHNVDEFGGLWLAVQPNGDPVS
jgi:predicted lipoprotein with Yx(FWY)xxD motif